MIGDIYGYYNPFMGMQSTPQLQPQTYGQTMQVVRVNGRQGAEAFRMGANSSALLLDASEKYAWYIQTDGAAYKTILQLDVIPHEEAPTPDYSDLDKRVRKIEEVLKNVQERKDNSSAEPTGTKAAYKPDAIV